MPNGYNGKILHVDLTNPALQFYASLGFRVIEQTPVNCQMEWVPPSISAPIHFSPTGR